MSPAIAIAHAFACATQRNPDLHEAWVAVSVAIGGKLPASMLMRSVQQIGEFDLLLRAMEDDLLAVDAGEQHVTAFNYLAMFSEFWVGLTYEVIRLLKERRLGPDAQAFESLAYDLRLLRIPLEKHELALDRKLVNPLQMTRAPSLGDRKDAYEYDKRDSKRAHIMPTGVSDRGSLMWLATDSGVPRSYWIERRDISDRALQLWTANVADHS